MRDLLARAAVLLVQSLSILDTVANPLHTALTGLNMTRAGVSVVHHGRVYGKIGLNPALGIASLASCDLDIA